MSLNKHCLAPPGSKRPGLLLLTPVMAAMLIGSVDAAPIKPKLTAQGKLNNKTDSLLISGTTKGVSPGSQVTVYNAENNQVVYYGKTDSKGKFLITAPPTANGVCKLTVEAGGMLQQIAVTGAASSCKTAPTCYIDGGNRSAALNSAVTLNAIGSKTAKADALTFNWNVSNTGPTIPADGTLEPTYRNTSSANPSFKFPGLYHVALTGSNSKGSCQDSVTISVAPSTAPATVDTLVDAATGSKPGKASALNAPDNAYVVLPFEETGMQGGSQVNLPYNPEIPYNSLNAQVLQKKEHKPPFLKADEVTVNYSAGVNPNDPVGDDSINSTSQNWFAGDKVGSNVDYVNSAVDSSSQAPTNNVFFEGQDFMDAQIRKTEQWDRMHQKNAAVRSPTTPTQTGYDNAWQQNRFTPAKPLAKPDEAIRGNLDNGATPRTMPGIAQPYEANDPQPTVYNPDQNAYVAQFIPASNVDDKGRTNPYPLMRVEATLKGQDTPTAKTETVFTTASETRCRECHLPGGIAADEDVWRTPVAEAELKLADGTTPGPATGAGSFDPGLDPTKPWPPAIHNHFDDRHPDKKDFSNLLEGALDIIDRSANKTWLTGLVALDANDRRTDRVKESRWVKLDANGQPTSETSLTRPAQYNVATPTYAQPVDPANPTKAELKAIRAAIADAEMTNDKAAQAAGWTIQFKVKFKTAAEYGDANDPIAQEKAALFNTLVMHDYMVFYGPTPATNKNWPASYSSQLADGYSEDDIGSAAARPQYFCSGHHQSQLKFDVGIGAKSAATNRSDYSRAFHAFHGKMQTYKEDVAVGVDGKEHKKGQLIRDSRGHPLMYGGRGWDSQMDDDNGIPLKIQTTVDNTDPQNPVTTYSFADNSGLKGTNPAGWDSTKFSVPTWDPAKNNWRPDLWPMQSKGQLMLQFGADVAMEDNCAACHTGKTEKSYRDIHHAAGLKCDNCHSDMLAVGNVFPHEQFDSNLTWAGAMGGDKDNAYTGDAVANLLKSEPNDFRRPWLDEPDCGSCHFGNANGVIHNHGNGDMQMQPAKHLFSAGVLDQAWEDGDKTGKSMMPMDARFAVMPTKENRPEKYTYTQADVDKIKLTNPTTTIKAGHTTYAPQPLSQALYRKSGDIHGSGNNGTLTCSTCHGGSHAIWPNPDPNANDNVTAQQLQGYDGNIAECSVCHIKTDFVTGLVATKGPRSVAQGYREGDPVTPDTTITNQKAYLAGPHGLHPVNDESWWKNVDLKDKNGNSVIHIDDFKSKVGNGGWHSEMTYKPGPDGDDQCAACHGNDHKGTRLSKTLTARDFVSDKGKKIHVEAGTIIGCDLCHKMDVSFKQAPKDPADPKGKKPKWPIPGMNMPPMPESISPVPAGSGGGHH